MTSERDRYKWFALLLIWCAVFLQQGVRQVYGATLPSVAETLGVTSIQIGLVGTVFTFVYGVTVISAGYVSDWLSRKWVLSAGVLLFAIGGCLSGFASGVGALVLSYGILNGLGQPLVFPPGMSLLMQLHGEETRATALSVLQSAMYVGIIACAVGSGWLADQGEWGWRNAYIILGALGVLLAVVLCFWMKDTRPAGASVEKVNLMEALRAIVGKPSAVLYGVYLILLNFVTIGFMVWTPAFVKDAFPDLPLRTAVFHSIVWMYLGAIVGVIAGGRLGDRLAVSRKEARLEILALGVLCSGLAWFCVSASHSLVFCGIALSFAGFSRGILDSNLNVSFFDVIRPRYHSSALGFMLGLSFVFGSLAPFMLGWMREAYSLRIGIRTFPLFYGLALVFILWSRFSFYMKDREAF